MICCKKLVKTEKSILTLSNSRILLIFLYFNCQKKLAKTKNDTVHFTKFMNFQLSCSRYFTIFNSYFKFEYLQLGPYLWDR